MIQIDGVLTPAPNKWTDTSAHPWRRLFARFLDGVLIGTPIWLAIGIVFYAVDPIGAGSFFLLFEGPAGRAFDSILTLLVMLPIQVLFIGLIGTSPGKWVFGVRVQQPDGRPIGLARAFHRELRVWTIGYCLGLPILVLLAMWTSKRTLEEIGKTTWDLDGGHVVIHRSPGVRQSSLNGLGVMVGISATIGLEMLARMPA